MNATRTCRHRAAVLRSERAFCRERDSGRARYEAVTDSDALRGLTLLCRLEGIIPALETAHAVAWVDRERARWSPDDVVLLCISGRGDKDVAQVMDIGIVRQ